MKIPASKVPAQVWADAVKSGRADNPDVSLLEKWERSKQVYRIDSGIWEMATVDDDTELPTSALSLMPFDCLFLQHKKVFAVTDNFCLDGQEYQTEAVNQCEGYFVVKGDGSSEFPIKHLTVVPLYNTGKSYTKTERMSDSYSVYGKFKLNKVGQLGYPWNMPLDNESTVGKALAMFCETMDNRGNAALEQSYAMEPCFRRKSLDTNAMLNSIVQGGIKTSDLIAEQYKNVLGSLLYIISKEADIKTVYTPQRDRPKKSKQTDCTVHEVGFNVSRSLEMVRRVYEQEKASDGTANGTHHSTAPHVRRAHWHGYWLGPRDNPTDLEIKWIAPIIVNGDKGELSGRVHDGGGVA